MGYYQGDYYQGDYYRGDPGFLSFLKKGAALGASFIPGIGGIASRALSKIPVPARRVVGKVSRAVIKHPIASAAGAAGAIGSTVGAAEVFGGGAAGTAGTMAPGMMKMGKGKVLHMPGMRRHKRMNVTNVKALRRSIRRTQGFAKLAMRVIRMTHPGKKARFGGFRKRTRRKRV